MNWREKVTSLTGNVVPEITYSYEKIIENEVMSNLPLQMALYFNVVFLPVWMVITSVLFYNNFYVYSEFTRFVISTVILAILIIEFLRLYLGYEGNLRDKVPELAGFWMLSVLLQFPLQGFFLLNPYFKLKVIDKVVQTVMVTLLSAQMVFGYKALKHTAHQQTTYFRIMKMQPGRVYEKY